MLIIVLTVISLILTNIWGILRIIQIRLEIKQMKTKQPRRRRKPHAPSTRIWRSR